MRPQYLVSRGVIVAFIVALLLIGTSAVSFGMVSSPQTNPTFLQDQPLADGFIAGTIYNSDKTATFNGNEARVYASRISGSGSHNGTIYTDGTYEIKVPPASYRVDAMGSGISLVPESYNESTFTPVVVDSGQTVSDIDFTLDLGGRISGTLYNADKSAFLPIDHTTVAMLSSLDRALDFYEFVFLCCNSTYSFTNLPLGIAFVASASGPHEHVSRASLYFMEYWEEARTRDEATPIILTLDNPSQTIDFSLEEINTIRGTLYNSDKSATLSNAWVNACSLDFSDCIPGTTNPDGTYSIEVRAGDYRVRAEGENLALEFYNEAGGNGNNATIITVGGGQTRSGIDFTLDPAGSISGFVRNANGSAPIGNIQVGHIPDIWMGGCSDATDGSYILNHLPLNVPIKIAAGGSPACNEQSPTHYQQEWWQETPNFNMATTITLTQANPHRTGIDFTLEAASLITGTIYNEDKSATYNNNQARINATEINSGQWYSGHIEPDGTYKIALTPGSYRVQAEGTNLNLALEFYNEAGADGANATPVVVGAQQTVPNIDFTLSPGGTISGTTFNADKSNTLGGIGMGLHGVWLGLCSEPNGNFTARNLPLNQPIRISAGGNQGSHCAQTTGYIEEFWQETPHYQEATLITLTEANPNVTGIDFSLSTGSRIRGRVMQADGLTPVPMANVMAELVNGPGGYGGAANPDGTYELVLPPGDYIIRAQDNPSLFAFEYYSEAGTRGDNATVVTVEDGVTLENINFTLDPGGIIGGVVLDMFYQPLGNLQVWTTNIWQGACTHSGGGFELRNMPLNVPIKIGAGGEENWCEGGSNEYVPQYWQLTDDENMATAITLTAQNRINYSPYFLLSNYIPLSGFVYQTNGSTPIAGAHVSAHTLPWTRSYETQTAADGSYTLMVAPGTYMIRSFAPNRAMEYYDNAGGDAEKATPVIVGQNPVTGINFSLDPGGIIRGRVMSADGLTPLANVNVGIMGVWNGTCSDQNGYYQLMNIPLDEPWDVYAGGISWCGESDYVRQWWPLRHRRSITLPITLTAATDTVENIDFKLRAGTMGDTLAMFNPTSGQASYLNTIQSTPPPHTYDIHSPGAPVQGQWVVGDWNGDGRDTPGVFNAGAFWYTNENGPSSNWLSLWLGPTGTPLAGRFNGALNHDCIGVLNPGQMENGGIVYDVFALWYTCDFSGVTPPITWHWVSAPLPTASGFSGDFHFTVGDWDSDGVETLGVLRGDVIAFTDVKIVDPAAATPQNTNAEYTRAQYWGTPHIGAVMGFVGGDWDGDDRDSFGVIYDTGGFVYNFIYRNNLDWNIQENYSQLLGNPVGLPVTIQAWRFMPNIFPLIALDGEMPLSSLDDAELEPLEAGDLLPFDLLPLDTQP